MYTVIVVLNSLSVLGRSRYTADFAAPPPSPTFNLFGRNLRKRGAPNNN